MLNVTPLLGIGPLLFGMSRAEVAGLIGPPTSRVSDDPGRETWTYVSSDLSLYFDAEDGWRLESLEISHPDTSLVGVRVFRRPYLAVLTDLAAINLFGAEVRSSSDSEETDLYFRSHFLHLWRDSAQFTSLSLGVPVDASDRIAWPKGTGNA